MLRNLVASAMLPKPLSAVLMLVLIGGISTHVSGEEFTSLVAHQHGHAVFSLALDGEQLFIELTAPAINVFGMEQTPTEPTVMAQLLQKSASLKTMQWLTLTAAAECKVQSVDVFSAMLPAEKADSIKRDAQQIASAFLQNDQATAENAKAKAEPQPKQHLTHEHEHHDVLVSASYHCASSTKLTEVTFNLWAQGMALDEISAQWILPHGQGAFTVTPTHPTIKL